MTDNPLPRLSIETLNQGLPGITPALGNSFSEACWVCLNRRNHKSGVELAVCDLRDNSFSVTLVWEGEITDQVEFSRPVAYMVEKEHGD